MQHDKPVRILQSQSSCATSPAMTSLRHCTEEDALWKEPVSLYIEHIGEPNELLLNRK